MLLSVVSSYSCLPACQVVMFNVLGEEYPTAFLVVMLMVYVLNSSSPVMIISISISWESKVNSLLSPLNGHGPCCMVPVTRSYNIVQLFTPLLSKSSCHDILMDVGETTVMLTEGGGGTPA